MKKILSFIAAGVLALGLIGCSGNLHDEVPSRIDLSAGAVPGAFNGWDNTTPWTTADVATGIYTYEFTAKDSSVEWKAITTSGDWNSGAYIDATAEVGGGEVTLKFDDKTGGGTNAKITGLTKGLKYTLTVEATESSEVVVKSVEAAGVPPTPYYLDGLWLVGSVFATTGNANAWNFSPADNLIKGAVVDATTGVVTYAVDITAIAASGDLGINDASWNNKQKGGGITVNADDTFVALDSTTEGNFAVTGLTTGKPYRVTIQTTPEKVVSVKIAQIASYTLKFKLTGGEEGKEYYLNGSVFGWTGAWPCTGWGGSYAGAKSENPARFATAGVGGVAEFTATASFVGKPGEKVSYEIKFVQCDSTDDANFAWTSGDSNLKFDVDVADGTFVVVYDVVSGDITIE